MLAASRSPGAVYASKSLRFAAPVHVGNGAIDDEAIAFLATLCSMLLLGFGFEAWFRAPMQVTSRAVQCQLPVIVHPGVVPMHKWITTELDVDVPGLSERPINHGYVKTFY